MAREYFFEVETPLGFQVRTTRAYWEFLVGSKHPTMRGRRADIIQVLADPEQVRRSRKDLSVYLFYRSEGSRWLCAVARRLDGRGFLITAYPTDTIKAGVTVWTRSS
ncbi:MAG: DUF4258 domain-containing protein [Planctomycetes bacterium]|nr:DUF4258 domain-containing protein [Planctomycetota bacterium]